VQILVEGGESRCTMAAQPVPGVGEKRAEIYTYEAPWLIYAVNWSVSHPPHPTEVALFLTALALH
jgi:hypothetical protein